MEVTAGYKPTEVGVIPEGWEVKAIREIARVTSGKRLPLGKSLVDNVTPHPYIRVTDMRPGTVAVDDIKYVPIDVYPAIQLYRIFSKDIFISVAGTLGIVGKVPHELDGANLTENADRITDIQCSQDFLIYVLASPLIQNIIDSIRTVGAQPKLALTRIREFLVPFPPLPEQRAIAEALSDADALLGALDRLIAKKRDIKQAAMQQLLTGQTRLPGFEGKWVELSMAERSMLKARIGWQGLTTSEYQTNGDHLLVTGTDFVNGLIDWQTCWHVSEERYMQDSFIQLRENDVLLTKDGSIGKVAFVDRLPKPATLNSGVFVIRPKDGSYASKFFYYILSSSVFAAFLRRLQAGSTISHLYQKDFIDFTCFVPPTVDEQAAVAAVLSDMDAELAALEVRRDKTRLLKQGMIQELLTGRTRLVEPQAVSVQPTAASTSSKGHNWAFNEAVVIATLAKHFGSEEYPLGRKRYTKLSYLMHRRAEQQAEGYLKKAAGPYNPKTKYGGPEKIAKENDYIRDHKSTNGCTGFIVADNIAQAGAYFEKWYGQPTLQWLEQFRYKSNDELELLATVDMAAEDLRSSGKAVSVAAVKHVIANHPEWEAKLDRPVFCDTNIAGAIKQCQALFGGSA